MNIQRKTAVFQPFFNSPKSQYFVIFIASFLPRLSGIGRYVTPDELIWVYRSVLFQEALRNGRFADTFVTGHPGIVTMWLGSLGIRLQIWLQPELGAVYDWITYLAWYEPENMAALRQLSHFLTAARLPIIAINSLGIVVAFILTQQLLGKVGAWLLVALLAFDPFVVGLSGLLHVDGLMMTFSVLALLLLVKMVGENGRFYPILTGVLTSLAILNKSPAVLLVPVIGLALFAQLLADKDWKAFIQRGGAWGISMGVTALVVLPALWSDPMSVYSRITGEANRHIDSALRPTFFMGEMDFDHGWSFYLIALIFRLSPIVLIGVGMLIWGEGRQLWKRPFKFTAKGRALFIFVLWIVLFIVGVSLAAKKFDRYMLPTIPALMILAVWGWSSFIEGRRWLAYGLIGAQLAYLLFALPYPLIAYSPLVGGAAGAYRVLPVGWGEGVSAAGQWLEENSVVGDETAVSGLPPSFAPFFSGRVVTDKKKADYIIQTASSRQINFADLPHELLTVIQLNGRDHAWIYRQAQPEKLSPLIDSNAPFTFADRVQLVVADAQVDGNEIIFRAKWRLQQNGRYTLRLQLEDDDGNVWHGQSHPLLNETYFYPEHWVTPDTVVIHYPIKLPPAIPPADYHINLFLVETESGEQLPLFTAEHQFQGVVYRSNDVTVSPPDAVAKISQLEMDVRRDATLLNESLILLGHKQLPELTLSGNRLPLNIFWWAEALLPENVQIFFELADSETVLPLSRYPSAQWRMGEPVHEKYELIIPSNLPSGAYDLRLGVVGQETAVSLATLNIEASDRLFQLPDNVQVLFDYQFGSQINLRGMDAPTINNGQLEMTLYWQTEAVLPDIYSTFIHILVNGENVLQADQWPAGLPSNSWVEGEIIIDRYTVPLPDGVMPSDIAIGLYNPTNGRRLPIIDGAGNNYPDDQLVLPITP